VYDVRRERCANWRRWARRLRLAAGVAEWQLPDHQPGIGRAQTDAIVSGTTHTRHLPARRDIRHRQHAGPEPVRHRNEDCREGGDTLDMPDLRRHHRCARRYLEPDGRWYGIDAGSVLRCSACFASRQSPIRRCRQWSGGETRAPAGIQRQRDGAARRAGAGRCRRRIRKR